MEEADPVTDIEPSATGTAEHCHTSADDALAPADSSADLNIADGSCEVNQDYDPTEFHASDTQCPVYDMTADKQPFQLAYSTEEFGAHFLKGCKWSRDGSALLTCCDDMRMRVFSLPSEFYTGDFSQPIPQMRSAVTVKEGGTIYDYSWYPLMDGTDPDTCCFLTTTQSTPIHMWESLTGNLRATYRVTNHLDEIDAARSVAFTPDGALIYAGFAKQIYVFDVNRPGKQIESIKTHKRRQVGQIGIISCFDFLPLSQIFAAGSYSKSVAVYDQRNNAQTMILEGHTGGVTQIKFSPDGNLLYSGSRKDNELLAWDMRSPGQILAVLERDVQTNQRMYFDIDPSGRYVCSGNYDGTISIWDMTRVDYDTEQMEQRITPQLKFKAHSDCVNSASFHPTLAMLTTSSGKRSSTRDALSSDSDSDLSEEEAPSENSVRFWWLGE